MSAQLGVGAMLHNLSGGSEENPEKYYGRLIKSVDLDEERLLLTFSDGIVVKLFDDGQSCCESRYITCDDEVNDLVGNKLVEIETADGGEVGEDEYDVHEQVFVKIITDKATITLVNHNEHNGYYGGFGLSLTEINLEDS